MIPFLKLTLLSGFLVVFSACQTTQKSMGSQSNSYSLVWSDEFDIDGLPQSSHWTFEEGGHGWGNNEKQYYLANSLENAYVKDGKLHIVALSKKYQDNSYTSAKLTTYQKLPLQYGKIEMRAQLPKGKGTWPAFWMLPESIQTGAENWPACGEIDIMEHVGKDPNVVHHSLHTDLYNHIKGTQITYFEKYDDLFETFHTYEVEWTETSIAFYIDGIKKYEAFKGQDGKDTTNAGWPFDKPYYIILNLAIGGNWGGEIDPSIFPADFVIDYVRVYQIK